MRYVLSPGGGHHVLLPPWVEAFPRASVLVGPARIPRTASGVFKDARKVGDATVVDACWREILAWPAQTVLTYHDPPCHGFHGDGRAALEIAARERGQILS